MLPEFLQQMILQSWHGSSVPPGVLISEGIVCMHLDCRCMRSIRCCVWVQVPVIAKADSMTLEELRQFRKYARAELEQVLPVSLLAPPILLSSR